MLGSAIIAKTTMGAVQSEVSEADTAAPHVCVHLAAEGTVCLVLGCPAWWTHSGRDAGMDGQFGQHPLHR